MNAPAFRRSLLLLVSLLFLNSTSPAATVNVGLVPDNPIQATSGAEVPEGTALFIVSYKTTKDDFFTALRGANSAATLVSVFQNQLQFFNLNNTPTVKGVGGLTDPDELSTFRGWTGGNPIIEVSTSSTPLLPIFALFSSSTNPFDSTASFLLVKTRGTDASYSIPIDTTNTDIEISANTTSGSDVIFGQFFSSSGAFQMATAGAYGQITSATTKTINAGSTSTYQILSNHGADTYALTSAPGWASINAATGLITLSPGTSISGTFTIGLSAINSLTAKTATGSLTVTVAVAAPVITSTLTATATRGTAFTYQIAASSSPTSFSATGLPGGLSINTTTGLISGIPIVAAGTFNVTVTATNSTGAGTATLVITLNAAPAITSTLTAAATRGTAFTYQIAADSSPTSFNATGLPGGLSINTSTGLISGTPNVAAGTFNVILSAANTTGTGSATLVITLSAAPVISSTLTATATRGTAFTYQIAADSSPASFSATGLPGGLSINTSTGLISGTPNVAAATFNVTLSATNTTGTGTATLVITLNAAPAITSTATATATRGTAFTYQIAADSSPASFSAIGLPGGLSINTSTGLISGTPNVAAGTFNVTLSATNATGTGTAILAINLSEPIAGAPVITSTSTATATRGTAFTYQIAADSSPTSFNATGLPGGLSINTSTGLISGTPNVAAGTFNVILSAANTAGAGTTTLIITLSAAPVISSTSTATATHGTAFTYQIAADSSPTSFNATGLPGGLSISTATGLISGTPNVAAGTFNVTLSATNTTGTGTATLVITLNATPVITSAIIGTATRGTAFTYQIAADSSPTSFNATGLPGGLSINTSTGLISGTPNVAAGTFNVTLSATNTTGTGTATLVITLNAAPAITSTLTGTATRGTAFTYQIAAGSSPTSFNATGLPGGLSISTATGLISGTPNVAAGTFNVTLSATNTTGTGTATLVITLSAAPAITSTATATATRGIAFTYQIAADSSPTSFNATGLPGGLSINTTTGLISGTPNVAAATFNVTVTATNATGTGTATLVLDLTSPSLSIPSLVSNKLTRTTGTAYSIPVTVPTGFVVDSSTLEPTISGVTYSSGNLLISSTAAPFAKGTTSQAVTLILNRTSGLGGATVSASLAFDLRLIAPAPTALTTAGPFEVTVGDDYSLQLLTDVSTLCPNQNIAIVGTLPPGLINNTSGGRKTGSITGKNTSTTLPYEFTVNVIADTSTFYEGGGTLNVPVIFRLQNPVAPVITSESTRLAGVGKTFAQYTIKADGAPWRFTANGLPPGIIQNGANLTGTPTQAGNYDVRLEVYNSFRPGSTLATDLQSGTATLRIFVSGSKPTTAAPLSGSSNLQVGRAASFSMLSAQQSGLKISGYGFPPGLTINSSTGLVTGTPTAAGTYSVTIFIQNGKGWIKKTVSLAVR